MDEIDAMSGAAQLRARLVGEIPADDATRQVDAIISSARQLQRRRRHPWLRSPPASPMLRAEDITLTPNRQAPSLLRLELGNDVHVVFDSAADDTAEQAAAMRKLARLAAEAAEELERRTAAQITETDR
jgi:hypothetical protein